MDLWLDRVADVWADETLSDEDRIAQIDDLASARPEGDALALFERAGARDAAGREAEAEPLYRAALAAGLAEDERTQAVIQLASTLRNLGRPGEAVELLGAEYARGPGAALHDETAAFYALALASDGRADAAASVALTALAPHLTRYRRSVAAYAEALAAGSDLPTANTSGSPEARR